MALVSADLNPLKCDPPSIVFMLLANEKRFSPYPSLYCRATSVWTLSFSPLKHRTFLWIGFLFLFRNSTKDSMPPVNLKVFSLFVLSSFS